MWGMKDRYFGLRGGWLTFWVTVACGTDMTLFGYDQGEWEDDCQFHSNKSDQTDRRKPQVSLVVLS